MNMKKTIVVASGNKGKVKEITEMFNNYKVISLKEIEEVLGRKIEVNEDKNSFKDNALQKVVELSKQLGEGYICIGDDSGISIDALDGFPGLHTARWMDADDHTKNLALLEKMAGIKKERRTCHYTTAIAIADANISNCCEYVLDGYISEQCRGENGFGFDEIFELENGKTLAELSSEEKYQISPRKKALEKIYNIILKNEMF